jgi:hypothetical protein
MRQTLLELIFQALSTTKYEKNILRFKLNFPESRKVETMYRALKALSTFIGGAMK